MYILYILYYIYIYIPIYIYIYIITITTTTYILHTSTRATTLQPQSARWGAAGPARRLREAWLWGLWTRLGVPIVLARPTERGEPGAPRAAMFLVRGRRRLPFLVKLALLLVVVRVVLYLGQATLSVSLHRGRRRLAAAGAPLRRSSRWRRARSRSPRPSGP